MKTNAPARPIRIFLVDDEPRVRRGLSMQLALEPDMEVVGETGDGRAAPAFVAALLPDVVVMDLSMDEVDGLTATGALVRQCPGLAVIVHSLHDSPATRCAALKAGAVACVGKHEGPARLVAAIRAAAGVAAS